MSDELPIIFSHNSDVGRVREHNEDCVAVEIPTDPGKKRLGRLFVVADGMGGYLAGEVASEMAVETVLREYYANAGVEYDGDDAALEPVARLHNAVQAANDAVYASAHSDRSHAGMGTTLVATAIIGHTAYIASVGDSRAYVVHEGELVQITQDHSLVGEQIRAGLITKEQARAHPQRNVITRALGSQPVVTADAFEGELAEGDVLLMCTDGLTGHVPDERLRQILVQHSPEQAVKRLIELANQDGGTDNISVIVVRVGQLAPIAEAATPLPTAALTQSATATTSALPAKLAATLPAIPKAVPDKPTRKQSLSPAWLAVGAVLVLAAAAAVGVLALGVSSVWRVKNGPTPTPTPVAATVQSMPPTTATLTGAPAATLTPIPAATLTPILLAPTPTSTVTTTQPTRQP